MLDWVLGEGLSLKNSKRGPWRAEGDPGEDNGVPGAANGGP